MHKKRSGIIFSMFLTTIIMSIAPIESIQASTGNFFIDRPKQEHTNKNLGNIQASMLSSSTAASQQQKSYTDHIAVSLIEFPNIKHNQIKPETDFYTKDFNTAHYEGMLFNNGIFKTPEGISMSSLNQYYNEQSGGFWNVKGVVSPWMQAKNNIEYYRDFKGEPFEGFGELVKETLTQVGQSIKGKENLYDQKDPDDLNRNGNKVESDGFLDNLVVVMAGATADRGMATKSKIWGHIRIYSN
ncbi:hypothetical protein CSW12_30365 (plasmid) [Bacillus cereus]|uniref:immune inhibitor A domain-containing protein n=1 Tax=Bacillus cereus TaxID=1396 RepID=UPI000C2D56D4|nr:immune inhibitor A domain-containing protein [Bacillus cereus]AUB67154.1 hypothetical protein CSW12_30365 [Bacillus cereus]